MGQRALRVEFGMGNAEVKGKGHRAESMGHMIEYFRMNIEYLRSASGGSGLGIYYWKRKAWYDPARGESMWERLLAAIKINHSDLIFVW